MPRNPVRSASSVKAALRSSFHAVPYKKGGMRAVGIVVIFTRGHADRGAIQMTVQSSAVYAYFPRRILVKRILAVACFCACATFALSQAPAAKSPAAPASAGPTKDPVATSLRTLLQRSQNNTVGAIE